MKFPSVLICVTGAAAIGYFTEPYLRPLLTPPKPAETASVPAPAIEPPPAPAPDPARQTVTLTEAVTHTDSATGVAVNLKPGSIAMLVRRDGDRVTIRPPNTQYLIEVPVSQTSLAPAQSAEPVETPPATAGESEPPPAQPPAPAAVVETPPEPPAPAVVETASPPPPQAEVRTPAAPATAQSPVAIMQQSVKSGEIHEFDHSQVTDWQSAADETVDGTVYQTGMLSYKAETIFGIKTIQAKAYIKDGRVARWVWPKSGLEIR
jgi:hypothetical protein